RGEVVRVVLSVSTPSARNFVAIEDPIPAGFEPINFALATTAAGDAKLLGEKADNEWLSFEELREERAGAYARTLEPGLPTWTYLARATTSGKFTAPAPRALEMYASETRGRGAAESVVIRAADAI